MNNYKEVVIKRIGSIVVTIPANNAYAGATINFDPFTRDVYIKQIVFRECITVNSADVIQLLTPLIICQATLNVQSAGMMDSFSTSAASCTVAKSPISILLSAKCDFKANNDQLIVRAGDSSGFVFAMFNTQAGNITNPIDYACTAMVEYAYKQQI